MAVEFFSQHLRKQWQIATAKVYFTERSWPDLDAVEFDAALALLRT